MGRILSNSDHLNTTIQQYISNATTEYSTLLNSAPLYCTYYSKDLLETSYDKSLENYNEIVGADSPIKFNKVENLPIYKVDNSQFSTDITDFGVNGNVTSTAILLPNTIKPMTDDVFVIDYNNQQKVFKITDIEQDNYNNNKFYKITFVLTAFNLNEVESQTEDEFILDYNNIGKVSSVIIKKNTYNKILKLEEKVDELIDSYEDLFYDPFQKVFTFKSDNNTLVIDFNVNKFIIDNNICKYYTDYRKFKYINKTLINKSFDNSIYRNTLYYALIYSSEINFDKISNYCKIKSMNDIRKYSVNWYGQKIYNVFEYLVDVDVNMLDPFNVTKLLSHNYLTSTNMFDVTDTFEKLLYNVLNNDIDLLTDDTFDNFYDMLLNVDVYKSQEKSYFILPIIIYVLNSFISNLNSYK